MCWGGVTSEEASWLKLIQNNWCWEMGVAGGAGSKGEERGEVPGNFEMLESNVKERGRQKNRLRWLV